METETVVMVVLIERVLFLKSHPLYFSLRFYDLSAIYNLQSTSRQGFSNELHTLATKAKGKVLYNEVASYALKSIHPFICIYKRIIGSSFFPGLPSPDFREYSEYYHAAKP